MTSKRSITTPRSLAALLAAAVVAALVAIGSVELAGSGGGIQTPARLSAGEMSARLAGSPAPLAALHAQAGEVLDGGGGALRARLAQLRGYAVVLNKWASWCEPCRAELGALQHASVDYGRRVAFIGIDSGDADRSRALAFLRSFPVSYPSYYDRSGQLGQQLTYSSFTPVTVFIARDGRQYIHQGPYGSLAKLERDVERYALDA